MDGCVPGRHEAAPVAGVTVRQHGNRQEAVNLNHYEESWN
jgi:hypothetical protein